MKTFVILLFGRTRVGKDTWIQTFFDLKANPGIQDSDSTTYEAEIYKKVESNVSYTIINLPGIDDSRLRFENMFVLEQIQKILIQNNLQKIDAILLCDSLQSETFSIKICLSEIQKLLGLNIKDTILAVGTKQDFAEHNGFFNDAKVQFIKECDDLGLKSIFWKSFENDKPIENPLKEIMIQQFKEKMNQLQPYHVSEIQVIQKKLEEQAKALMAATPLKKQTSKVSYTENVQIPYDVIESRKVPYQKQEQYADYEQVQKTRMVPKIQSKQETYYESVQVCIGQKQKGGLFNQISRQKKDIYETQQIPRIRYVDETINVPEVYYESEQVMKTRYVTCQKDEQYTVTKYRTEQVQKQRETIVDIPHKFESFLEIAKAEWIKEITKKINQNTRNVQS